MNRGFTLLEVLIAFLLATTLLLGLWGIMGIYSRLFESGKAKAEQSQLARALLEQLADDLRSTIQDAPTEGQPAGAPPAGGGQTNGASSGFETPSAVRRFGLFGSAHAITFDVLQVTPEQAFPPPEKATSPGEDEPTIGRAPELRTLQYTFVEPEVSTEEGFSAAVEVQSDRDEDRIETRPGLTRRELDFEPPKARGADSKFDRTIAAATAEASGRRDDLDDPESEDQLDDPSITWVPEVVGLSFRYFDGRGWSSTWDSLQRKSLPVAVEARIEIESFDPRDRRRRLAEQEALDDEVSVVGSEGPDPLETDRSETAADAVRDDGRRIYRLVIDLPTATAYRGVQAAPSRSALPAARSIVPRPLPAPSLRVPRSESDAKPATRPSDQWMRTNSP